MHDPKSLLLFVVVVMAFCSYDLRRALKPGRAAIWLGGTATRAHQPKLYWRHIYQGWAFLAFDGAVLIAILLWPDRFR